MSGRAVTIETAVAPPLRLRLIALGAVSVARILEQLPPRRLRQVLEFVSRGARPADLMAAHRARNAVVAVSLRCAGPRCLQRSIAACLVCRVGGRWPQWHTGVRTQPFQAHAWIEVDGRPVDENEADIRMIHRTMVITGKAGAGR